jgi:spore germination protein KC
MKRMKTGLLLLLVAALCTGCWDATDINKKDIVSSLTLDKKDGMYIIHAEVANLTSPLQNPQSEGRPAFSVVMGQGKTFKDMRNSLETKLDRQIFLGTMRVLVVTLDAAKNGLDEYLNRMREDVTFRKTGILVGTNADPNVLLNTPTENETSTGNAIEHTLLHQENQGTAISLNVFEILEYLSSDHKCFVIPNFGVKDQEIALTGYMVIHKGVYYGLIPFSQSKGMVYFLNENAKWIYSVPYGEDQRATVAASVEDKHIKPHYSEGKVSFDVEFTFHSVIQYLTQNDGLDDKAQKEVKANLQELLTKEIYHTIEQAQNIYQCDYLNFDDAFRVAYPEAFENMDWYSEFLSAQYNIRVKTDISVGAGMDYSPAPKK